MAFIRVHGNQLALVHGVRRDGKVVQEVFFTLYSKAEAKEALGLGSDHGANYFERIVQNQHPEVRFEWPKIREEIADKIEHLPEAYDQHDVRLRRVFRDTLVAFTRQLLLADPQDLDSAATLLQEHRAELDYLQQWLTWRRRMADERTPSEFSKDNAYLWRYAAITNEIPPEVCGELSDHFEKREFDILVPRAKLLVEAFPNYADGFNLLGLVAMEREQLAEAIAYFEQTIVIGRSLFPKRIAKDSWWSDHATRPYMRGLGNLAVAFNRAGKFEEALAACDRLDGCGHPLFVQGHRASVFLNLGRYEESASCSAVLVSLYPESGFELALALCKLGRPAAASPYLIRAVLSHPRAAKRILGMRLPKPRNRQQWKGDERAVQFLRDAHAYVAREGRSALAPLRNLLLHGQVETRLCEIDVLEAAEALRRGGDDRAAYDRLAFLRSAAFSEQLAAEVAGCV